MIVQCKIKTHEECTAFLKGETLFYTWNYDLQRSSDTIKIQMLQDSPFTKIQFLDDLYLLLQVIWTCTVTALRCEDLL